MSIEISYKTLITEAKDQIFYITINREDKLNALNIQTLTDIKNAILSIYNESSIRGVIITGKGSKAFAAGADKKVMPFYVQ
jgi:enoyl-CoA hydratase